MRRIASLVMVAYLLLTAACSSDDGQPVATPKRIGFVGSTTAAAASSNLAAFREGMRDQGFAEGEAYVIEMRYAEGRSERISELARDLARIPVDVFLTAGTPQTMALKQATQTIPIVAAAVGSPAETGLVTLGGNVAAINVLPPEVIARQVELLREATPGLRRMALIWNSSNPSSVRSATHARTAAAAANVEVMAIEVQSPAQLETTLPGLRNQGAQAIFLAADPQFFAQRQRIGEWLTAAGLPAMCQEREYGEAGCLLAYGANIAQLFRQSASYVVKILQGTRASDLPVGTPDRIELLVNAASARKMGLTLPESLLRRADSVVQ